VTVGHRHQDSLAGRRSAHPVGIQRVVLLGGAQEPVDFRTQRLRRGDQRFVAGFLDQDPGTAPEPVALDVSLVLGGRGQRRPRCDDVCEHRTRRREDVLGGDAVDRRQQLREVRLGVGVG
jgi:hypothetical protein